MGQVETKTIYIGGNPGGYSGEMVTLTERTYLNLDKTLAVGAGPDAAFLLGNEGDQVHIEDAIKWGLIDPDEKVAAVAADADALAQREADVVERERQVTEREEELEKAKAEHAETVAAQAAAEDAVGGVPEADGDAAAGSGGDGDDGSADGSGDAPVKEAGADGDKNTEKPVDKSKGKGATK